MHPILFTIAGFPIHTFGVMVLLGVMAGLWWIKRDAPRLGMDGENVVSLGVEVFLAGLLGSRIFFVVHNWEAMYSHVSPLQVLNLRQGGLVWYGGLLAAAPVGFWRARRWGLPVRPACDVLAAAVLLGLAIGRIGCLMAGDDHGRINFVPADYAQAHQESGQIVEVPPPRDMPEVGVRYAERTWYTLTFDDPNALMDPYYRHLPLLPAQPAMSLGCFLGFFLLAGVRRRLAHAPSALVALLFIYYPLHRFLVEYLRGDPIRGHLDLPLLGQVSTSQAISLPILPLAGGVFAYLLWRHRGDAAPGPTAGGQAPAAETPREHADAPEAAGSGEGAAAAAADEGSAPAAAQGPGGGADA